MRLAFLSSKRSRRGLKERRAVGKKVGGDRFGKLRARTEEIGV